MSLIDEYTEDFTIIAETETPDGYGGSNTTYTEIGQIQGALSVNNTPEVLIAQSQGVSAIYTLTTKKDINLKYHTILKRNKNNQILLVTSDGSDVHTPKSASLNIRQVTCTDYKIEE